MTYEPLALLDSSKLSVSTNRPVIQLKTSHHAQRTRKAGKWVLGKRAIVGEYIKDW
jgi:hypothetical protein